MAFIEASLEELPVSANFGQSCLATKISAPGPSSFGWLRHNSGATHSFISAKFGARIGLDFCHTKGSFMITTPSGKIAFNQIIRQVPIKLGSKLIKTYLILLNLEGMDVILGMNWMTTHKVLLDISSRAIEIDSPYQGATILHLPQQECLNSCAYAIKEIKIEDIPVVCEYADVFPDDLPGMPP